MQLSPRFLLAFALTLGLQAQVYSPKLLREGQPDATDLKALASGIFAQAHAHSPREKAEAIWRFFLTDGRFVPPGFFYHIAGWAYEEPGGEVLDPVKLLNSYGFGLCYHIAPLLEAVFEAGGFEDARCWFLTGHTVAEVFYDGGYHYFDSDMMGYNVAGTGSFRGKPVASVHEIENDGDIILGKLSSPDKVIPGAVDAPWYPADVQAKAMGDLAALFTTAQDNKLYPFTRYSLGHKMDWTLRRGESITRFFQPEQPGLFYLPYKFVDGRWSEFPQDTPAFQIRVQDGPHSQKDARIWATGRIEYQPPGWTDGLSIVIDMPSPYVILDAHFGMQATLPSRSSRLKIETSTDGGTSWELAGRLAGAYDGRWSAEPKVETTTAHGRLTAVSGKYGYLVRLTRSAADVKVGDLHLTSRIEINPRTLPMVQPGTNRFHYSAASPLERLEIPTPLDQAPVHGLNLANEHGQKFLFPAKASSGYVIYRLAIESGEMTGFDVGARFLDMPDGIAPDKLTAETRLSAIKTTPGNAQIAWSVSPNGPFRKLWEYPEPLAFRDRQEIGRLLRWPDVLKEVRQLPGDTKCVYVRISTSGPAIDNVRLALYRTAPPPSGTVQLLQVWREGTAEKRHLETIDASAPARDFVFNAGQNVSNGYIAIRCQ